MDKTKIILAFVSFFLVISTVVHLRNWLDNGRVELAERYSQGLEDGLAERIDPVFGQIPEDGQIFRTEKGLIILIPLSNVTTTNDK